MSDTLQAPSRRNQINDHESVQSLGERLDTLDYYEDDARLPGPNDPISATPHVLDFRKISRRVWGSYLDNGKPKRKPTWENTGGRPISNPNRPTQIRARARRKYAKKLDLAAEELAHLYKPIEEWDAEELARGQPRDKEGGWRTKPPRYVDRTMHEEVIRRFEQVVKMEMNSYTIDALALFKVILNSTKVDKKGRPLVAYTTKLDAAKFLIEHVIGKPKQRTEVDISVKLQSLLGSVMVQPTVHELTEDNAANFALLELPSGSTVDTRRFSRVIDDTQLAPAQGYIDVPSEEDSDEPANTSG